MEIKETYQFDIIGYLAEIDFGKNGKEYWAEVDRLSAFGEEWAEHI